MKNWNKIVSLLLAIAMCLSLAACASKDDKAFEEANALLEAGDYDGAIAAFSAIGRYQEISSKIEEATKLREEANAGFLFGTWMDLNSNAVFTFAPGGTATLTSYDSVTALEYEYANDTVTITAPIVMKMNVAEVDGIQHITLENYDLISEADYAVHGPKPVEITLENWAEYFEIREAKYVWFNPFGDLESSSPGYGIFLKDEYYDRLANSYEAVQVDFEVTYDEICYKAEGYESDNFDYNLLGEYTLTPTDPPYWADKPETGLTATGTVYDRRRETDGNTELDPFYQKVAAQCSIYGATSSDSINYYYYGATNIQVSRVQGTLLLFAE